MRFYRDAGPAEQTLRDWLEKWPSQRTQREIKNFLATCYLMQDEAIDANGLVERLFDSGTHADVIQRMTEAIAYVVGLDEATIDRWLPDLTMYHDQLVDQEDRLWPEGAEA